MVGVSLFLPLMMIGSIAMMFGGNRFGSGRDNRQLTPAQMEIARREYFADLDELRDEVHESARAQFDQFQFLHPIPSCCWGRSLASDVGAQPSLEDQMMNAVGQVQGCDDSVDTAWGGAVVVGPHFGYVRFGVGRSGLSRSFDNLPQLGRPADYEPVTFQGSARSWISRM
jgi:S-DNA-T family DNA segregation ATPase FtsK/SpoIIIE